MIDKRKLNFIISTWACYLGRRTHCSLQRNYQKLVEEAPSTLIKFLFARKNGQNSGEIMLVFSKSGNRLLICFDVDRFNHCHNRNTTKNCNHLRNSHKDPVRGALRTYLYWFSL